MKKITLERSDLEDFIAANIFAADFINLHLALNVSRRFITLRLKHPERLLASEVVKLSKCTNIPVEKLLQFCVDKE